MTTLQRAELPPQETQWSAEVAHRALPAVVLGLRLTMGWIFVWAGFDKLIRGFSAEGFLVHATKGPFSGMFQSITDNAAALTAVEQLVIWGEILIGVALIFGVLTRFAALWGAAMMLLFYLAQLPPAHNPFMEYYLIYVLVLAALGTLGAGRILGLDAVIGRHPLVQKIPGAAFLLG